MRLPQTPSQFDYNPGHGHGPALYLPATEPDVRVGPGDHHEEVHPPPHNHPQYHQPPQQMRLPVTVGICKLCKRVYRPEVGENDFVMLVVFFLWISLLTNMTLTQDETDDDIIAS